MGVPGDQRGVRGTSRGSQGGKGLIRDLLKNGINDQAIKKFVIQIEDTHVGISMSTVKMFTCLSPSSDWIAAV